MRGFLLFLVGPGPDAQYYTEQVCAEFALQVCNYLFNDLIVWVQRCISFCNWRTVFQFLAVPGVFSFFSIRVLVSFERAMASG